MGAGGMRVDACVSEYREGRSERAGGDLGPVFRISALLGFILIGAWGVFASGCVPPARVLTPLLPREYPKDIVGQPRTLLSGFGKKGGQCLKEEVAGFLGESKTFEVVVITGDVSEAEVDALIEEHRIDVWISGEVDRFSVVIAPSERKTRVYAIGGATMRARDLYSDEVIWSKKDAVLVEGQFGRDVPERAMRDVMCKNLATKMLNDFTRAYLIHQAKRIAR